MAKLWAGRSDGNINKAAEDFNSSVRFDKVMFKEDIKGSMAHASMLGAKGIIPQKCAEEIIDGLDGILADIFAACPIRVSVKTRMGFADTAEFPAIAEIYRKYPISRLIVHSRDRAGMYKSRPDVDGFASELRSFPFPVEYNGDIFSPAAAQTVLARCPEVSGIMIGRGAVANPALFRMLRGGKALEREELQSFHDALLEEFLASGLSPVHAMARLK